MAKDMYICGKSGTEREREKELLDHQDNGGSTYFSSMGINKKIEHGISMLPRRFTRGFMRAYLHKYPEYFWVGNYFKLNILMCGGG